MQNMMASSNSLFLHNAQLETDNVPLLSMQVNFDVRELSQFKMHADSLLINNLCLFRSSTFCTRPPGLYFFNLMKLASLSDDRAIVALILIERMASKANGQDASHVNSQLYRRQKESGVLKNDHCLFLNSLTIHR